MPMYSYDFNAVKGRIIENKRKIEALDPDLDAALASCAAAEEQLKDVRTKHGLFQGVLSAKARNKCTSDLLACEVEMGKLRSSIKENGAKIQALKDQILGSELCQQKAQFRTKKNFFNDCKALLSALQTFHSDLQQYIEPWKLSSPVRKDPRFETENLIAAMDNIIGLEQQIREMCFEPIAIFVFGQGKKTPAQELRVASSCSPGFSAAFDVKVVQQVIPEIDQEIVNLKPVISNLKKEITASEIDDSYTEEESQLQALLNLEQEGILYNRLDKVQAKWSLLHSKIERTDRNVAAIRQQYPDDASTNATIFAITDDSIEASKTSCINEQARLTASLSTLNTRRDDLIRQKHALNCSIDEDSRSLVAEYQKLAKIVFALGAGVVCASFALHMLSGLTIAAVGFYVAYNGVRLFQDSKPTNIETKSLSLCTMSLNALA
ncbi:MAG: hypothetical protein NXI01_09480 [Gammaproteobacteria bacterium]|nr:hypothetical protein [Gammaproteobacteria bacterium]